MSFSVSTCITVGASGLGSTLQIYKNPISPTNFGTYLQNVAKTDITGANCPYTFEVPDDTTEIRIYDISTYCYVDFTVGESTQCSVCNLDFNNKSNDLIGTINVGNLTGSCDPTITDYKIAWYGPDSSTNLSFTSGKGTSFPGYGATHPLTGTSAPFVLPGTYVSRITDVELNGVKYSVTGGTGTGSVLSSGLTACSVSFNVSAYTCNNGTYDGPYYEHEKEFVTDGSGTKPQTLQTAFKLSANTECFIWQFFGYSVYDTLKLTYSGSAYSEPLVLENLRVGQDSGTNLNPSIQLKLYQGLSFKKITNLSGLTVNEGDLIIIQITPNENEDATSWKLRFGCYGQPTAEKNCLDAYQNQSYKIRKDSLSTPTPNTCGNFNISFEYSGCSSNQNSGFTQSDLYLLTNNNVSISDINTNNTTNLLTKTFIFGGVSTGLTYEGVSYFSSCVYTTGNVIKITKTVGQITFFFSSINDLSSYYTNFNTIKSSITNLVPPGIGGTSSILSNDNSNVNYFRRINLRIPSSDVTPNSVCDTPGVVFTDYWIHPSSTSSSGTTSGGYTMTITLQNATDNYVCPECWECSATYYTTYDINQFYNLTFTERTYNNGLKQSNPFYYAIAVYAYQSIPSYSSSTSGYMQFNYDYSLNTYPSSGFTNTLIPSLSATTWDFPNHFHTDSSYWSTNYYQYVYQTQVVVTSTSPTVQFKLYSKQISNWMPTGNWIEIYDSTNPSVFDSNYMY